MTPEELLASLRPKRALKIMDLVEAAEVNVGPWSFKRNGAPVANPRANPHYCYEWAFGGDKEPTVLCVWHENLSVEAGNIVYVDNVQELARNLQGVSENQLAMPDVRSRAKAQAGRAWEFDLKVQRAFRRNQQVRLVVLEGEKRDSAKPGIDRSQVKARSLDPAPWTIAEYDDKTYAFKMIRTDVAESDLVNQGVEDDVEDQEEEHSVYSAIDALTKDDFVRAFMEVDADLSPQQREMLVGHASAQDRMLSMERIAKLAEYDSYGAANFQYGRLGAMLAEVLILDKPANWTQVFCYASEELDEAGHFQWVMREEAYAALSELDMVPNLESIEVDESGSLAAGSDSEPELPDELPTVRTALTNARVGQGTYREKMIRLWDGACAVTGCSLTDVLIASHALPWRLGTSRQRLDHFNGLLLTANFDRLFDVGLISFSDEGELLISEDLADTPAECAMLGIQKEMKLRKIDPRMLPYLSEHRRIHGFVDKLVDGNGSL